MACCSSKPAGNYYRYPLKQNRNSNIEIIFHLELKVIMNSMIYFDISRQGDPSKILYFIPTTFRKDVQHIHETKHYGCRCARLEILHDPSEFVWLSQQIAPSTYWTSLLDSSGPPIEPISHAPTFRHYSAPHPSLGTMLPLSSVLRWGLPIATLLYHLWRLA
jgi:hypothetical protein